MNKYVIAFLDLSKGELLQEIVEANSALEAGIKYLNWWDEPESGEPPHTLEDFYNEVFNCDSYINVLDLNKALGTGRSGGGLQTRISQFDSESRFQ